MKKLISLFLALLVAVSMAAGACADGVKIFPDLYEWPHNHQHKHKMLMIIYTEEGMTIEHGESPRVIHTDDMRDAVIAAPELIPEDCNVNPDHLNPLETWHFSGPEDQEATISYRVWGSGGKPVLVFYQAEDSEEWQLVKCQLGTDVEVTFPGYGYYAVGRAW